MSLLYAQVCSNHLKSHHCHLCHRKSKWQPQGYRNRYNLNDRLSESCNFVKVNNCCWFWHIWKTFKKSLNLSRNYKTAIVVAVLHYVYISKVIPVGIYVDIIANNQTSSCLRYIQWVIKPIKTLMISLYRQINDFRYFDMIKSVFASNNKDFWHYKSDEIIKVKKGQSK